MKKVYLKPNTDIVKVAVQNLLAAISGTGTGSVNPNDPNSSNDGPGYDGNGGDGGMSKGFGLYNVWED